MKPLTACTIQRARHPSYPDPFPPIEGLTDGGSFGIFKEYGEWNVTHLATGASLMRANTKANACKVMAEFGKLPDVWSQAFAIRKKYDPAYKAVAS